MSAQVPDGPVVGGAVLVSIGLGWLIFGPFLRRGAGLEGMGADEIVGEAEQLVAKLFARRRSACEDPAAALTAAVVVVRSSAGVL